jgi:hypothetical protein
MGPPLLVCVPCCRKAGRAGLVLRLLRGGRCVGGCFSTGLSNFALLYDLVTNFVQTAILRKGASMAFTQEALAAILKDHHGPDDFYGPEGIMKQLPKRRRSGGWRPS